MATKVRFPMGDGANDAGLSRHHLIRGLRGQPAPPRDRPHRPLPGPRMGRADPARGDARARSTTSSRSGKVRYVGCSNFAGWQVMKALGIADRTGLPRFVSQQVTCRCRSARPSTRSCPRRIDQGLGVLIWSPLAGGLLSGKYRRGQDAPSGSRRASDWSEPPIYDEDKLYDTIEAVVEIAEGRGVSPAQVALAWLLEPPGRHERDRRRPHRRAARRQPGRGGSDVVGGGDRAARGGQPAAADLSVLASGATPRATASARPTCR